jgi:hypothetical protein
MIGTEIRGFEAQQLAAAEYRLTELSIPQLSEGRLHGQRKQQVMYNGIRNVVAFDGREDRIGLLQCGRHGFFRNDGHTGFSGRNGVLGVEEMGSCDRDGVQALAFQHLAVVCIPVGRLNGASAPGFFEVLGHRVGYRHNPDGVRQGKETCQMVFLDDAAAADQAEPNGFGYWYVSFSQNHSPVFAGKPGFGPSRMD